MNRDIKEMEELIKKVTVEVLRQLRAQAPATEVAGKNTGGADPRTKRERIDMSGYRTPLLTENHIRKLHELTGEVLIPRAAIITPKARELARDRKITITRG